VAASACAERAEPPENVALGAADVTGWDRVAAVPHDDVHDYDQVAAAPTEDGVVWFTRAGEGSESLAVWSVSGGQPPMATDVATPGAVTIPVGVAADLTGSWLVGTSSSGDVPRDAEAAIVQRLAGDELADEGSIAAEPGGGVDTVDVNGIAVSGDWLVVAGAGLAGDGGSIPALWAGRDGRWTRSTQAELVGHGGRDVRAVAATGSGPLVGLVTERAGIDVEVWRSPGSRN
jgi:hypothetical protein